jgi:hypothetical protein
MGETTTGTRVLTARTDALSVWIAVIVIPLFLIAPALWNGYPLLQWDTGGYLARWYEGYLVPSRSTVFGLFLHFGEGSGFWLNLGVQALATLWILQLTLRVLGISQPFRLMAISLLLMLTTALPWLASTLLTDIFAGLSVLALFILVAQGHRVSSYEKFALRSRRLPQQPTARRWECFSDCAASASWCGLSCARHCHWQASSRQASRWSLAP